MGIYKRTGKHTETNKLLTGALAVLCFALHEAVSKALHVQVRGGNAPQWARLQEKGMTELEDSSLHAPFPGLLHIHLYLVSKKSDDSAELLFTGGPAHSTALCPDPAADGRQTPAPGMQRHNSQPSLLWSSRPKRKPAAAVPGCTTARAAAPVDPQRRTARKMSARCRSPPRAV